MTIVAIWHEAADDALWAVADTRISFPLQSGGTQVRTEIGAKLLLLPTVCRRIATQTNLFPAPHFWRTYGFAFAGDVLPAILTHAHASTFLQNLVNVTTADPPMLREVADMVRRVATRVSREMLTNDMAYGRFECSIFGECPHSNRFEVYGITPLTRPDDESKLVCNDPYKEGLPILLGDAKEQFNLAYEQYQRDGDPEGRTLRLPKRAIERIISEGVGTVGGSLSIGMVCHAYALHERSFQLLRWLQPIERGKPQAICTFNGMDVDSEIGQVGPCIIGMLGMI
ncbi:hypothetical protein [Aestuariivirga sp.]|uniref:hypothetical protein n=1 Tax=Aestuariivirga sp. TaxID=2650926 RepID=UPI003BAB4EBF